MIDRGLREPPLMVAAASFGQASVAVLLQSQPLSPPRRVEQGSDTTTLSPAIDGADPKAFRISGLLVR